MNGGLGLARYEITRNISRSLESERWTQECVRHVGRHPIDEGGGITA